MAKPEAQAQARAKRGGSPCCKEEGAAAAGRSRHPRSLSRWLMRCSTSQAFLPKANTVRTDSDHRSHAADRRSHAACRMPHATVHTLSLSLSHSIACHTHDGCIPDCTLIAELGGTTNRRRRAVSASVSAPPTTPPAPPSAWGPLHHHDDDDDDDDDGQSSAAAGDTSSLRVSSDSSVNSRAATVGGSKAKLRKPISNNSGKVTAARARNTTGKTIVNSMNKDKENENEAFAIAAAAAERWLPLHD
eukprot:COSAG06_NODE_988_length_11185_cov_2.942089_7_plen_246_part_00